jgi:cruciform cutting endonuclease 1
MALPKNQFSVFLIGRGPTVKGIQSLLQRIGAPTSGTKDVLQSRLFREAQFDSLKQAPQARHLKSSRILSIDMGIKNLAFCVADVSPSTSTENARMDILSWRRLDLTDDALKANVNKDLEADIVTNAKGTEADPFAPEFLSQTAYWLLSRNLLRYKPDVILIERQRWRSSSSSAIQQWTVRVNSLEAMLWAILTALRAESNQADTPKNFHRGDFTMFAMDPKRVGAYWLDDELPAKSPAWREPKVSEEDDLDEEVEDDGDGSFNSISSKASARPKKKLSRGKAEKKAKIQLLRSWLNNEEPSTSLSMDAGADEGDIAQRPFINFSFHDHPTNPRKDAETTRQTFLYATDPLSGRAKRAQKSQIRTEDVKKVDDLADCLLQAAAYVAWAQNRAELQTQFALFKALVKERMGQKLEPGNAGSLMDGAANGLQSASKIKKQKAFTEKDKSPEPGTEFESLLAAALQELQLDHRKEQSQKSRAGRE